MEGSQWARKARTRRNAGVAGSYAVLISSYSFAMSIPGTFNMTTKAVKVEKVLCVFYSKELQ